VNETKAVYRSFEAWLKAWEDELAWILAARLTWEQAGLAPGRGHTRVSVGKAYAFPPRPTTAPASEKEES